MTTTLGAVLAQAAGALAKAGFDEPRRRARGVVSSALQLSPSELLAGSEHAIDESAARRIGLLLERMLDGEPLSRIIGVREFWGLSFALSADTLDPRPESETVIEAVLKRVVNSGAALRLLDLGTGTGCLLLSLLSELPAATGFGLDVAEGAVVVARRNAAFLGLSGRTSFAVGNWGAALSGPFDAIVANPPYIAAAALDGLPREVRCFDPWRALDGGADGLTAYRAIGVDLPRLLGPGGIFATEIGADRADCVSAILQRAGLRIDGVMRDLAGFDRCVVARYERCGSGA